MNSIIQNIEIKSFNFKSLKDVNEFRYESITIQSLYFTDIIGKYIKVVSNNDLYYYNINTKLWTYGSKNEFETLVYIWFDNSAKEIKKIIKNFEIDEKVENDIKIFIKVLDNKNYITNIITRTYTNLFNKDIYALFDAKADYLPIKDGKKINLKTLKVSDRTKDDFFTYESKVEYLDGELKHAERFFSEIMPNETNREYLRKCLGYMITGETDARCFFIAYGHGANGKSAVATFLELILGKQFTSCDKSIFMKSKRNSGGSTEEIMALIGKRVGVYSEGETADNIEMNTAGLKQISGEDSITGRCNYGSQITFKPYVKLFMPTNYTPPLHGDTSIIDRLKYIYFDSRFCENPTKPNEFKIDKKFIKKLQTKYLSEIFSWIVRGSKEYYSNRKIIMPEEFKIRTNKIIKSVDSIETYLERGVVITHKTEDYISITDLFNVYKEFCNSNSQRCQKRSSFITRLDELKIQKVVLNGYDGYRGLKIIDLVNDIEEKEYNFGKDKETNVFERLEKVLKQNEELKNRIKELEKLNNIVKPILTEEEEDLQLELEFQNKL